MVRAATVASGEFNRAKASAEPWTSTQRPQLESANVASLRLLHCLTMTYLICKGTHTAPGLVKITLERGEAVIVIKGVPAAVCTDCGEYVLAEPAASRVYAIGEDALLRQAEVEVVRYAA
jgi:YgiT-type zinc finger domain-containing protein